MNRHIQYLTNDNFRVNDPHNPNFVDPVSTGVKTLAESPQEPCKFLQETGWGMTTDIRTAT